MCVCVNSNLKMLYSLTQSFAFTYSNNNNKATARCHATKCLGRKEKHNINIF